MTRRSKSLAVGAVLAAAAVGLVVYTTSAQASNDPRAEPGDFTFVVRDATPEEIAEAIRQDGGRADAELDEMRAGDLEGKKARDEFDAHLDEQARLEREADEYEPVWRERYKPAG